ncbi:hypothetical protein QBC37DRAFT_425318 [Rhypophila decipiens]|uniref:Uncharacterized protein n=1 Tax=Rhypophila decipiens TaxID=261697 RepID=A0AAN6Y401_9PEZI|nr:hypothetical protein QBC37DRAFT_425318 [Rhypophila decipiens]
MAVRHKQMPAQWGLTPRHHTCSREIRQRHHAAQSTIQRKPPASYVTTPRPLDVELANNRSISMDKIHPQVCIVDMIIGGVATASYAFVYGGARSPTRYWVKNGDVRNEVIQDWNGNIIIIIIIIINILLLMMEEMQHLTSMNDLAAISACNTHREILRPGSSSRIGAALQVRYFAPRPSDYPLSQHTPKYLVVSGLYR